MNPSGPPVLQVESYTLDYATGSGAFRALEDVSLSIRRGQVLGLVGESGSGKTSMAYAILRYLPANSVESGAIRLAGEDLRAMPPREIERLRGSRIAMVFQDPSTSLNPTLTLGEQLREVLERHRDLDRAAAHAEGEALLARVGIKDPAAMMARYPHEASGGEKQRVVIASAFAASPDCILFDEPTTALDVITAQEILKLFAELQADTGVASLYISHDLALVSRIADRVAVIHRGRIVEEDPADSVFTAPREPYTRSLISAVPRPDHRLVGPIPPSAPTALLATESLRVRYGRPSLLGSFFGRHAAEVTGARDVSLTVHPSEILGLVGESGSGKSTIAKALVGITPFDGTIRFNETRIESVRDMDRAYRRAVQIVFQNPDSSLNPRQRVSEILGRPLRLSGAQEEIPERETIRRLLDEVQLPAVYADRFPHQLSGGEKQRVAIARAFASRPALVICDEITSSLDVSVQAAIVGLLLSLRDRFGTAYLFITHDLNLVRQIAHRIAVMYRGELVEVAEASRLGGPESHPYTRALIEAVPAPLGV